MIINLLTQDRKGCTKKEPVFLVDHSLALWSSWEVRWCLCNFSLMKEGLGRVVNLNSFVIAIVRLCLNKQALQLTLKLIKPVGLIVILHSQHNGVQEHTNQYSPIKCLCLDHATHF